MPTDQIKSKMQEEGVSANLLDSVLTTSKYVMIALYHFLVKDAVIWLSEIDCW